MTQPDLFPVAPAIARAKHEYRIATAGRTRKWRELREAVRRELERELKKGGRA